MRPISPVGMIGEIEELAAQLHINLLGQTEVARQGGVEVEEIGADHGVWLHEGGRVEPA